MESPIATYLDFSDDFYTSPTVHKLQEKFLKDLKKIYAKHSVGEMKAHGGSVKFKKSHIEWLKRQNKDKLNLIDISLRRAFGNGD